ncbi:MAG: rod-binding protein [Rhodospirillaceae bacterium]
MTSLASAIAAPVSAPANAAAAMAALRGARLPAGAARFAASLGEASAPPSPPVGAPVRDALAVRPSAIALNSRTEAETRAAIHKSASEFESSTLGQLLGFITQNVEVDPVFGGGHGEEMFRDMMNTEYGKMLHKGGRAGIADQVERQLLRAQGLKPLRDATAKA